MENFYLAIVVVLFLLAISDLVVGVSNDAVNFLNSAVGAKAATLRTIMIVAALGIVFGCTFSSGMMEVARKGIFHPELFYFSEIMIIFLAVMVTDVILLDSFNSFGMPTSTTVSIVFELLGAAVAISMIKILNDPFALGLGEYINSGKALAIISGILLSVVVAFSAGALIQYLSRLLFSFDYEKRFKYFGSLWGGVAIAAITYFILVKGAKGASFMEDDLKNTIANNSFAIISLSFVGWAIILQLVKWFTNWDILKIIVLVGTFALAMAFAGNDLVNFIGVPLAGYHSYELFIANGSVEPGGFLMDGLTGKVSTPTLLLLIAGLIMTVTLWTSKKAKKVIKTSLDLGRQYEGSERFASYAVSRSLVRNFGKMATRINNRLPNSWTNSVTKQFDERPFIAKQASLGADAPAFDMLRASVTLVVASILIAIGTSLKLPLSTTYVTFMVFMGTSLADGAWGRESAVYRVSGVLSVIGGWFFTAFSAFTVAFIVALSFYYGGVYAIVIVIAVAAFFIYRSHRMHGKRLEEQIEFEKEIESAMLSKTKVVELSVSNLTRVLGGFSSIISSTITGLEKEDLHELAATYKKFRELKKIVMSLKLDVNRALDKIDDEELEAAHLYILVVDYLEEMSNHTNDIIKPTLDYVDNNHKPLLPEQLEELKSLNAELYKIIVEVVKVFKNLEEGDIDRITVMVGKAVKSIRSVRKRQIRRIKNHEIGTRNSLLYLNHLGEFRNLILFSNRLVTVFHDLIINPEDDETLEADSSTEVIE